MSESAVDLERRQAEKERATNAIQSALTRLSEQGRLLDSWEQANLVEALSSCYAGCYHLAVVGCQMASTPPEGRSRVYNVPGVYDEWDLPRLSACLRAVLETPVRRFPHFGPIS